MSLMTGILLVVALHTMPAKLGLQHGFRALHQKVSGRGPCLVHWSLHALWRRVNLKLGSSARGVRGEHCAVQLFESHVYELARAAADLSCDSACLFAQNLCVRRAPAAWETGARSARA